jgi:hypothetical protein
MLNKAAATAGRTSPTGGKIIGALKQSLAATGGKCLVKGAVVAADAVVFVDDGRLTWAAGSDGCWVPVGPCSRDGGVVPLTLGVAPLTPRRGGAR